MSERIVEGLWDCAYCGHKGIGGLQKHCPNCGHPQDDDVKFYMGEKKNYLDEDLAKEYGKGADWVCPYCSSLNRFHFTYCSNCGAPKDSSEKDYFTEDKKEPASQDEYEKKVNYADQNNKKPNTRRWVILGAILALIAVVLFVFWPRNYNASVVSAEWSREVEIEAYRTVQESDWSVPAGGRVYEQKREFHHYEDVLDHYETRTRQVAVEVQDGYDYHTEYVDNGDGTFTEKSISVPRYRTEYRTETYQEPVYRQEPRYATKYYYDIDKWIVDRTKDSRGKDNEPYWPEYRLADNERVGSETEEYILTIGTEKKTYTAELKYDLWKNFKKDDKVEITVSGTRVVKINGESID